MKTAMKRLLSFVLVAMMLVSVLPFQASAAATTIDLYAQIEGQEGHVVEEKGKSLENSVSAMDLFLYFSDVYKHGKIDSVNVWWLEGTEEADKAADAVLGDDLDPATVTVYPGMGVKFNLKGEESKPEEPKPEEQPKPEKETWTVKVVVDGKEKATGSVEVEAGATVNKDTDAVKAIYNEAVKGLDVESVSWSTEGKTVTAAVTLEEENEPLKDEYTVTFIFCPEKEDNCDENVKCDGETVVRTTVDGKLKAYDVPTVPARYGYTFAHWYNETNKTTGLLDTYTSDVTYKAVYEEKADSNMHKLQVYGITYNHGKTNTISTPLATIYVEDNTNLLTALKGATGKIKTALSESPYSEKNDFEWDGVTFYDDDDMDKDDEVSSGTKVTGDGNYYVKVKYTGNDKVQIYVHTSKSLKIKDTVTLTTYAPGETITKSKIIDAVEDKGWSYKYFYTYTENEWEKIVDGGSADQTKSFTVKDGVTEIHVYLTNASSSGSVNNSDNPKTGDTILMAVTAMGLSATALAAVYFFMKKRAI